MNHDGDGGKEELCRLGKFVLMGSDAKSDTIQLVVDKRDKQIWLFHFRICVEMQAFRERLEEQTTRHENNRVVF